MHTLQDVMSGPLSIYPKPLTPSYVAFSSIYHFAHHWCNLIKSFQFEYFLKLVIRTIGWFISILWSLISYMVMVYFLIHIGCFFKNVVQLCLKSFLSLKKHVPILNYFLIKIKSKKTITQMYFSPSYAKRKSNYLCLIRKTQ